MAAEVSRLEVLLRLWADGESDEAQTEELFALIRERHGDAELNTALAAEWERIEREEPMPWVDWEGMFMRVVAMPAEVAERRGDWRIGRRMGRRVGWRLAAAAAVVVVAVGVWLLWGRPEKKNSVAAVAHASIDVLPGGNRATLRLAGGGVIVLDSATNGLVAKQGGMQVQKSGDGRITYEKKATTTDILYNTLTTPRGGQYHLTLADGTEVWLNAASSITYPTAFAGAERKVVITGEAYFEVKPEAARPFVVHSGSLDVTVLGTSVDINTYTDEPMPAATLITGRVRVSGGGAAQLLAPGEQARLGKNGMELVPHADIAGVLAWKNGRFAFDGADLPTVMRQLARWYDVDVSYEGVVPKRTFDGKLPRSLTLDQVLRLLAAERIHYTIEPGRRLVIRP